MREHKNQKKFSKNTATIIIKNIQKCSVIKPKAKNLRIIIQKDNKRQM